MIIQMQYIQFILIDHTISPFCFFNCEKDLSPMQFLIYRFFGLRPIGLGRLQVVVLGCSILSNFGQLEIKLEHPIPLNFFWTFAKFVPILFCCDRSQVKYCYLLLIKVKKVVFFLPLRVLEKGSFPKKLASIELILVYRLSLISETILD